MNIINTAKISKQMGKIGALSALAFAFGALAMVAPATASAHSYGGYGERGGNSYYGGSSYYPSTNSSSASAASASASSNSNTNVNVNVNVPVTVVGGGYAPVSQPIYPQQPIVYNYPTAPTYYGNYNYNTTPTYAYTNPAYNYNYNSYPTNYNTGYNYNNGYNYNTGLSATCNANTTSANIGQPVTWSANVTGGSGYYTYVWSGSSNLYGSGPSINATYNTNGQQTAEVTVTSNSGQSVTAQCTNSVIIGNGYNGNGNNNSGNGLTIGCAAGASDVPVGTPVTWSVEVTGGSGAYTYAWSGTNGLAGSQTSVATTYTTPGVKQAVVIVTSSNGMTGSQSCTPLTVIGAGGNGGNGSGSATVTPNTNNSGLSAASLFSLSNIPWGWVAVLIILVLFGTVMYMLFNKNKI